MDNINELYALPVGLKKVETVDDIPLYGSKSLNEKFIESISKTKRGRPILNTVKTMVNTKKIIPCFADPGIFSYLRRRLSQDKSDKLIIKALKFLTLSRKPIFNSADFIFAFYEFNKDRIILIINNHISEKYSFTAIDNVITISLTHEMVHMLAHQNPSKFISIFNNDFISYYSTYFKQIFKLNDEKTIENEVESIYKYFFRKFELSYEFNVKNTFNQLNKLQKFSNLNSEDFKNVAIDYIKLVKLSSGDIMALASVIKKFKYLILPLYNSYKQVFGKIPVKGCSQELVYPSEVICGYSDIKFDQKISSALNLLK